MVRKLAMLMLIMAGLARVSGQEVYVHVSNERIYDFLDELANQKMITLNSVVKPYTRKYVYNKFSEALDAVNAGEVLTIRQQNELEHYLDYYAFGNRSSYLPSKSHVNLFRKSNRLSTSIEHLSFFYSDSFFNFSLRPVLGINHFRNSSGDYTHTYRGLEAFASVGKYLALYADLRDNTVDQRLVLPSYFTQEPAGIYKGNVQGRGWDFSEMRGGILLSWDFLQVGAVKDHPVWGNNYNGATILSGRMPSVPMIRLHVSPVKWLDFNYFHAWLVSDVVDSTLTYLLPGGQHRDTYENKFMVANMFTVIPVLGLNLSFGNSIIYSDQSVNLAYLIPVFFYKSVDHTLTSYKIINQNSQMFIDFSARLLKNTHFFLTAYWDDFATGRIFDPGVHNFYSYKLGGRVSNWPLQNVSITGEYFRSVPANYRHYVPTLTYESNSYNLGHYLRDNSQEVFVSVDFKPVPRLFARYSYTSARHGNEYVYETWAGVTEYPVLQDDTWTSVRHSLVCSYEFLTNCHLTLEYLYSNVKGHDADGRTAQYYLDRFTPEFFQGKKHTLMFRMNIGF
ncbi:MAG: hypothetical protein JXA61_08800 [Bacteroidales bacterium]|nr:hypothetical protein [Bacteroidales bacterium]